MNNIELQSVRKLLMLSVDEASEFIGGKTKRAWRYWEDGTHPVPEVVDAKMLELLERREEVISHLVIESDGIEEYNVVYPVSVDDLNELGWNGDIPELRAYQSACAEVYGANLDRVKLVDCTNKM